MYRKSDKCNPRFWTLWHMKMYIKYRFHMKNMVTNITKQECKYWSFCAFDNVSLNINYNYCSWSALLYLVPRCGDLFWLLPLHPSIIKCPLSSCFGSAAVRLQFSGEQFSFYKWIVYSRIIIFVSQMPFLYNDACANKVNSYTCKYKPRGPGCCAFK